jgi:hypothetical protein
MKIAQKKTNNVCVYEIRDKIFYPQGLGILLSALSAESKIKTHLSALCGSAVNIYL